MLIRAGRRGLTKVAREGLTRAEGEMMAQKCSHTNTCSLTQVARAIN